MTPFPIDMIGAGERVGNTTPPSIALLSNLVASLTVRSRLDDEQATLERHRTVHAKEGRRRT